MNATTSPAQVLLAELNAQYMQVHLAKENLYWATYMGTSDDHDGFVVAEQAYKAFIGDPANLARVRTMLATLADTPNDPMYVALSGWEALFACNIMPTHEAKQALDDVVAAETALLKKRGDYVMHHVNDAGQQEAASIMMLLTNLGANNNLAARESSHQAMRDLEKMLLEEGFIDVIKKRNVLARSRGFDNFFEYQVRKNEKMSGDELFAILDAFEVQTRPALERTYADLVAQHGPTALEPRNLRYYMSGEATKQVDPYYPFEESLDRWIATFGRMGVDFRGATMKLDLMERKGKYQNGFCHAPVPSHVDAFGQWVPAQVNLTAMAKPDQIGSGWFGHVTLIHEGAHAVHFASCTQQAPCFSQEFAPTSMSYCETQAKFFESLLGDADWIKRYAKDRSGNSMPDELIKLQIRMNQPRKVIKSRSLMYVSYFENDLYRLSDDELTTERILSLARHWEKQIMLTDGVPFTTLAIPHLINLEWACSYHSYLIAEMAVFQTRDYFLRTDGYITDNPRVGGALAEHYWQYGNGRSQLENIKQLTGEAFNPAYFGQSCCETADEAWANSQKVIASASTRPQNEPASLNATIEIVHGAELVTDNRRGDGVMVNEFKAWLSQNQFGLSEA